MRGAKQPTISFNLLCLQIPQSTKNREFVLAPKARLAKKYEVIIALVNMQSCLYLRFPIFIFDFGKFLCLVHGARHLLSEKKTIGHKNNTLFEYPSILSSSIINFLRSHALLVLLVQSQQCKLLIRCFLRSPGIFIHLPF